MKLLTPPIFSVCILALTPLANATAIEETKVQKVFQAQLFKEHDDILRRHFDGSAVQFALAIPLKQRAVEIQLGAAEAAAQGQAADLIYESAEMALRYQFFSANSMQLLTESRFSHINYEGAATHSYNQYGAGLVARDYWGGKLQVEVRLGYLSGSGAAPSEQKGTYSEALLSYPVTNDLAVYLQWTRLGKRDTTGIGARYLF